MADVAADVPVVEATPVDEVKETVKEVAAPVEPETAAEAPEVAAEDAKETENGNTNGTTTTEEEAPKENGSEKNGHSAENGDGGENGTENGDLERKRKSELPVDGEAAIEVSSEKKAKLEEKSEDGVANGGAVEAEAEVVA